MLRYKDYKPAPNEDATAKHRGLMKAAHYAKLQALAAINSVNAPLSLVANALGLGYASPLTLSGANLTVQASTAAQNGYMSAADKALLDALVALGLVAGTAWVDVGSGGAAPAFAANWANLGAGQTVAAYRKLVTGHIEVQGTVKKTAAFALPDTIWTMPVGSRPTNAVIRPGTSDNATNIPCEVRVTTAGAVLINRGPGVATTGYMAFHFLFDPAR